MPRRVGVLGSLCNPPHVGHAALARAAAEQLGLELVLLVPTGEPAHRAAPDVPAEVRLELAEAAAAAEPVLVCSSVEVDREGPSFMADTLEILLKGDPGATLVLLLGADQHATLDTWHDPDRIRHLAEIAVAPRAGSAIVAGSGCTEIAMPVVDVSSTGIRARVRAGEPIDGLVAPGVAHLIEERGLYRETS